MIVLPRDSYSGPLPPLTAEQRQISERLHVHVQRLAQSIGERNVWRPAALAAAADYIRTTLAELPGTVAEQSYQVLQQPVVNLEWSRPGAGRPDQIVVVGAHYDSVFGCPGANDNGTGVAALLEIARLLADRPRARTLRIVAFVNEEPPFFQTDEMGSRVYARNCRQRRERVVAMYSLETIGCYSDEPGSQQYPFPLERLMPDVGNFLAFVGNLASYKLARRSLESFRRHVAFPAEGVAAPGWMTGIGWSDQWSFWKEGYRAVMMTDTAPYRYRYYHTAEDTIDKIDFERLARVVTGLAGMAADELQPA